ncbi:hypothetical protein DPPLL_22350 [Desulfofustis limnaeus]|uniref:CHAT domain-containing protein n=1 Tax=Desulfofustis limnaeus TaxID=2740163 RepID=A0ABM7WAA5_9BACT|nr:hypothetical protein DPPLL_22350 [Desulfofustis limnaeus]
MHGTVSPIHLALNEENDKKTFRAESMTECSRVLSNQWLPTTMFIACQIGLLEGCGDDVRASAPEERTAELLSWLDEIASNASGYRGVESSMNVWMAKIDWTTVRSRDPLAQLT